jgi:enhancing lycopene biosynthesis protein 2
MALRVGVILSGCGVRDGSEIHEAVSVLVAIDRHGAVAVCMAPNKPQTEVVNHFTGEQEAHSRNVLYESARIARGKIRDVAQVRTEELDALVFPGGFGAVKNLCTYAAEGTRCGIDAHVTRLLTTMHQAGKPIGLACIAPVIAAAVFGKLGAAPELTIGTDAATAAAINQMGGVHHEVGPVDVYVDPKNRLVTTPCYMNDVGPWTVFQGADRMIDEVLRMAGE